MKDVDWQNETIAVDRSIVRGRLGLPKHDKTRRVHVPESLLDELATLLAERSDKVRAMEPAAEAERQMHRWNGLRKTQSAPH